MARALLTDVLPSEIVSHVIEPYYDLDDLLFRFLDEDELNEELWKRMFTQRYGDRHDSTMVPWSVQQKALDETSEDKDGDKDLLIITLMAGYFDTFNPADLFTYKNRNKFTDLVMWVYIKRYRDNIKLDEFLLAQYDTLLRTSKYSTLLFLVKQVGTIFDIYSFLEKFILQTELDEYESRDDPTFCHAMELIKRVINHGITKDYRPLDHRFLLEESKIERSVFDWLIYYMPELAGYYIDTFEVDEVLDYMSLVVTETYLHTTAQTNNVVLYQKLQAKKPILARIKNRRGEYAHDLMSCVSVFSRNKT